MFALRDKQILQAGSYAKQALHVFYLSLESMKISLPSERYSFVESWLEFYAGWEGRRVAGFGDPRELAVKLLADSFSIEFLSNVMSAENTVDLGSGNGWPGLAVRLLFEDAKVSLLDSRQGACEFMDGFIRSSGLSRVEVIQDRAEQAGHKREFREKYTLVSTRAMARPRIVLELCSGFLAVGGKAVLWIGPGQEIPKAGRGLEEIGLSFLEKHTYLLPEGMGTRILAVYSKETALREEYPRRYNRISKKPLK